MSHSTFFSCNMSPAFCTAATPCWASCFASTLSWAFANWRSSHLLILLHLHVIWFCGTFFALLCLVVLWESVGNGNLQYLINLMKSKHKPYSLSRSSKVSSNVHGTPGCKLIPIASSDLKCLVSFLRSSASVHIFFLGKQGRPTRSYQHLPRIFWGSIGGCRKCIRRQLTLLPISQHLAMWPHAATKQQMTAILCHFWVNKHHTSSATSVKAPAQSGHVWFFKSNIFPPVGKCYLITGHLNVKHPLA